MKSNLMLGLAGALALTSCGLFRPMLGSPDPEEPISRRPVHFDIVQGSRREPLSSCVDLPAAGIALGAALLKFEGSLGNPAEQGLIVGLGTARRVRGTAGLVRLVASRIDSTRSCHVSSIHSSTNSRQPFGRLSAGMVGIEPRGFRGSSDSVYGFGGFGPELDQKELPTR